MEKRRIYMDNHATTPMDPRVLEAMLPWFTERFGNAASRNHPFGWEAEAAVSEAREEIAALINGRGREVLFVSGATESDNLAIKGVVDFYREKGSHVITCMTEHKAVLDTCKALERSRKAQVTSLGVDQQGQIDLDALTAAIRPDTILISIMLANNEIGTIQPIAAIGKIAKERGILLHCDATQGFGKLPIDVEAMGIDLLSASAHKIYGPKGVGLLWVRSRGPRVRLSAQMDGGGHERGMRSGTLNVPGVVGFARAASIAVHEMAAESARIGALRDRLERGILSQVDEVYLNGHPTLRLPGNSNLSFAYIEGESLLMGLNGSSHADLASIAVSSGSACTSATLEPSYILKALGVGDELAHTSIRFGLGRFNTEAEVDYVIERVVAEVRRLRDLSPLYDMAKEGVDLKSFFAGARH